MNGLDRFREYAVPNVSVKQGLSVRAVAVSILAANDGVHLDCDERWLERLEKQPNLGLSPPYSVLRNRATGVKSSPPASLFQDSTGRIWIATRSGFG